MKEYIYAADVYCEKCGRMIKKDLKQQGLAPADPSDEHTYDSGEYPKGPYDCENETTDSPAHCGNNSECLDPLIIDGEKYGKFLETPLTSVGDRYVRESHRDNPSKITKMWMDHYGLTLDAESEDDE